MNLEQTEPMRMTRLIVISGMMWMTSMAILTFVTIKVCVMMIPLGLIDET
jgi:hypothetical protein